MDSTGLAREWMRLSANDLRFSRSVFESMSPRPLAMICYHCQQAAEKALKGFLPGQHAKPPKNADAESLCGLCMEHDTSFVSLLDPYRKLKGYDLSICYPGGAEVDESDAVLALREAGIVYALCAGLIPELGQSQDPAPAPQQSM